MYVISKTTTISSTRTTNVRFQVFFWKAGWGYLWLFGKSLVSESEMKWAAKTLSAGYAITPTFCPLFHHLQNRTLSSPFPPLTTFNFLLCSLLSFIMALSFIGSALCSTLSTGSCWRSDRKSISLISHSDVRYRGTLAGIDPGASTIQLSNGAHFSFFRQCRPDLDSVFYGHGVTSVRTVSSSLGSSPRRCWRKRRWLVYSLTDHRMNSYLQYKNHINISSSELLKWRIWPWMSLSPNGVSMMILLS